VATWLQVDGPNYLYGMGRIRTLNVQADADCRVAEQFQSNLAVSAESAEQSYAKY
jgi:hypothetical protein